MVPRLKRCYHAYSARAMCETLETQHIKAVQRNAYGEDSKGPERENLG